MISSYCGLLLCVLSHDNQTYADSILCQLKHHNFVTLVYIMKQFLILQSDSLALTQQALEVGKLAKHDVFIHKIEHIFVDSLLMFVEYMLI